MTKSGETRELYMKRRRPMAVRIRQRHVWHPSVLRQIDLFGWWVFNAFLLITVLVAMAVLVILITPD